MDSMTNIMPVLHLIIHGILATMFQQMNPFLINTIMKSVVNITKTLMERNSNSWSRMSPNFCPIGETRSLNPANNKFDSYLNLRDFLSKSCALPFHSILKPWNDTLCNSDLKAFRKSFTYRSWMSVFSRLNSISIMPILDGSVELRHNLF